MHDPEDPPTTQIGAADAMALVARYLGAGEPAKARTLLDKLLIAAGGDTLGDPSKISLHSAMAYIYAKLERPELSIDYAQFALLNDPSDALALSLLSDTQKIHIARSLMHHRRAESAAVILKSMLRNGDSHEAAYYVSLLAYFDGLRAEIAALPDGGKTTPPLVLNLILWGSDYVESLMTYGFPSLLAAGNLPLLARRRRIIIDIFTTPADRDAICASPTGKAIMAHATLRFTIFPDNLLSGEAQKSVFNYDRWLLAGAQQCSALYAQRIGADLTFINSSSIYCADFFSKAAKFIDDGYQAVVISAPRAMESAPLSQLKQYADIADGAITVDAPSLTRFIIDNLHPHNRSCFIATQPTHVYQSPVALLFRTNSGFVSRSFQMLPVLISHRLLSNGFSFGYLTLDARFFAELLRAKAPDGVLKVITNPAEEIVVADIDTQSGPGMKAYERIDVTTQTCATAALTTVLRETDLAFYEWALRQRFEYSAGGGSTDLPQGGLKEDETIQSVIGLIRAQSQSVAKTLRLYQSAPKSHSA
jgi:hypothetical protein